MMDITELKRRLDQDEELLVLDVRTPEDYAGEQGHIRQSTLIPLEQLAQRLDEINAYLEKPVVTICRTDCKSAKAAQILAQHGFADVHVARMGMTEWRKNDYPVEH
jgi:rhodanese-related sulfurtransferase